MEHMQHFNINLKIYLKVETPCWQKYIGIKLKVIDLHLSEGSEFNGSPMFQCNFEILFEIQNFKKIRIYLLKVKQWIKNKNLIKKF